MWMQVAAADDPYMETHHTNRCMARLSVQVMISVKAAPIAR